MYKTQATFFFRVGVYYYVIVHKILTGATVTVPIAVSPG
jgi:hypothetical protein